MYLLYDGEAVHWPETNLRLCTKTDLKGTQQQALRIWLLSVKSCRSTSVLNMASAKTVCGFSTTPSHLAQAVAKFCWSLYGHYQTNHIVHSTVEAKKHLNFTFHAPRPVWSVCLMTCWLEKWVKLSPLNGFKWFPRLHTLCQCEKMRQEIEQRIWKHAQKFKF